MSAHISEARISNLRKMAEAVTERWPSRNVSAEDLGLQAFMPGRTDDLPVKGIGSEPTSVALPFDGKPAPIFCGAEPRRADTLSVCGETRKPVLGDSSPLTLSAEMPTAPNHFEFNEESADGPDPHDCEVESDMEREARDGDQR